MPAIAMINSKRFKSPVKGCVKQMEAASLFGINPKPLLFLFSRTKRITG